MKKILSGLIFLGAFFFVTCAFAQTVKIVDLQGDVTVQKVSQGKWEKAKSGMLLDKDAQIKTGNSSKCLLAFDNGLENVIELKENSQIKIESIFPGRVFLPAGRVFALIDSLSKTQEFQVRTPTAIAGARGTGWLTSYVNNNTLILCFDDQVYIQGFNQQGNLVDHRDLTAGLGVNIGLDGVLGQFFQPSPGDYANWNAFESSVGEQRNSLGQDDDFNGNSDSFSDFKEEQKEDYSQETLVQELQSETNEPAQEPAQEPNEPEGEGQGDGEDPPGDYYTHY